MTADIVTMFRKSSYSDQEGDCVEVALTAGEGRAIRDSKQATAGMVRCGKAAWISFITEVSAEAGVTTDSGTTVVTSQ
ncbi:hypothetical protein GCM10023347_06480 [Streptomyces chumphonensis]|uniref:DUF397 domain-containing protein n=1 Tax=Streptomyces chumphonensis TaxID=1214925 RepID=A0A927IEZ7_9ACTN|nr:DUF397 domain-containing protein [Streptomyces chumphonensis]MBD3934697.1 DUF397 domain-containing protein [Streptomyces chumphonensis]